MKRTGWILLFLLAILAGCGTGNTLENGASATAETPSPTQTEATAISSGPEQEAENMQKEPILMVDDAVIPVIWEENSSVAELSEYASGEPIHIDMHMYGGWEQVGSLGCSVSRNDVQMTALPGDIMLYSGNQIVLFYGENTWAYTKLGHIDLSEEDVTNLLSRSAVSITLAFQ